MNTPSPPTPTPPGFVKSAESSRSPEYTQLTDYAGGLELGDPPSLVVVEQMNYSFPVESPTDLDADMRLNCVT